MDIGDKFDSAILDQIKSKHLKPKARWIFLLKDFLLWSLGIASLFLGAIAFSVIIFVFKNNDWDLYDEFSGSLGEFILLTMPYFWIVFLVIFIAVVNYDLKHTKRGYKYSVPLILFLSVFGSMFLGAIFYGVGLGQALDDILGERVVFYKNVINPTVRIWNNPSAGRLAGLVIAEVKNGQYRLLDIGRNEWLIDVNQAELSGDFVVEVGRPIKLLGKAEGAYYFVVNRIFHHEGPGRGMMMHMMREGMIPPPALMDALNEACSLHNGANGPEDGICPMPMLRGSGTEIMIDTR